MFEQAAGRATCAHCSRRYETRQGKEIYPPPAVGTLLPASELERRGKLGADMYRYAVFQDTKLGSGIVCPGARPAHCARAIEGTDLGRRGPDAVRARQCALDPLSRLGRFRAVALQQHQLLRSRPGSKVGEQKTDSFFRMFMVPGMYHCRGGPGPNSFGNAGDPPVLDARHDVLMALEQWVERGVAPDRIIAEQRDCGPRAALASAVSVSESGPLQRRGQYRRGRELCMRGAVTQSDDVLIYAVGDIGPSRPDPDTLFDYVRPTLRKADVAFMQLELPISERGARLPQVRHTDRSPKAAAPALRRAGFTVASMAGNHCMDWGADAMFDTVHALRENGLGVVGVGANIAEARKPVISEVKGRRVAFLAYSSILPDGILGGGESPGVCADASVDDLRAGRTRSARHAQRASTRSPIATICRHSRTIFATFVRRSTSSRSRCTGASTSSPA